MILSVQRRFIYVLLGVGVWSVVLPPCGHAVQIETVTVGDPGNLPDIQHPDASRSYGAVAYNFRIGKYEITNAQYTEFLNAVARADPNGLYHSEMALNARSGIVRHGSLGNFSYSVKAEMGELPVTFVSFLHGVRFANWLHNGQPIGMQDSTTTEDGAYTITPDRLATGDIFRNPGATWFIPSEDEWYKAAYYDPVKAGGPGYWLYPTRTNVVPYSDRPGDNDAPDLSNTANYYNDDRIANGYNDGFAVTGSTDFIPSSSQLYTSKVGAYSQSSNAYGTFDQGGNILEWTEGFDAIFLGPSARIQRGGAWNIGAFGMASSYRNRTGSNQQNFDFMGFRIATIPEPSAATLTMIGILALVPQRRVLRTQTGRTVV